MEHAAGLDVSVKETSVCIVDETGKIVREVKVASEPDALLAVLTNSAYRFKRIGLEAGPLSQWLFSALAESDIAGGPLSAKQPTSHLLIRSPRRRGQEASAGRSGRAPEPSSD